MDKSEAKKALDNGTWQDLVAKSQSKKTKPEKKEVKAKKPSKAKKADK